jgi:Asp-tRNA(Asn)/Glu-tRNA(Gln) amidotransferase C subunit
MSIVNNCMVVNLQVGIWMGHRLDKEASQNVTRQAKASGDAARVNKHLIPKEALQPVVSAAGAVRTHLVTQTLPWKDNGDRLLIRRLYTQFVEKHSELVANFDKEVEHFLKKTYVSARDQAEFRMGALFKADDYPTPRALRTKFYINLDIDAISTSSDFRVELDKQQAKQVKSQIEEALQARMTSAMGEVWKRLEKTLGHFADKLGSDEIFRDTTVTNLEEIVDLLPDLNITNDPNLEKIRKAIKNKLIGYDVNDLRKDEATRTTVADEAKKIMDTMSGFMNAFGGGA